MTRHFSLAAALALSLMGAEVSAAVIPTLVLDVPYATVAKRKWDERKVSRDESGRFIAQAGHRDNVGLERVDAHNYLPRNNFDPLTTQKSDFKPVKPQRTTIFIQSGGKTYRK